MAKLGEQLGSFIFYTTLTVGTTILRGWVLSILWLWFIVSTFGLPLISIPVGIGISTIAAMLTKQANRADLEREDVQKASSMTSILLPLLALFVGYLAHLFM